MEKYDNINGNSSVIAYEAGDDFICVTFYDGSIYTYTYESAGTDNIEEMKNLANQGCGLSAFINHNVRYNYANKQR